MCPAISPEPSHKSVSETEAAMREFGIIRVPAETFEFGGYRYTNIKDAVAEAQRHQKRSGKAGS